jgi:hypothetical protein
MKIPIRCPSCGELLLLDEEVVGLNVRCAECGHEFQADRPPGESAAQPRATPKAALEAPPTAVSISLEESAVGAPQAESQEASTVPPHEGSPAGWSAAARWWAAIRLIVTRIVAVLRHAGPLLTPRNLYLAGIVAFCISTLFPFYAAGSRWLPGSRVWEPWSASVLHSRPLVAMQAVGLAMSVWAVIAEFLRKGRAARRRRNSRAGLGILLIFVSTWLLAGRRAAELTGGDLRMGGEWDGIGVGAGLTLAGAALAMGAAVRSWHAPLNKPYWRLFWTTTAATIVLVGCGVGATLLRDLTAPERFRVDATVVPARNVAGQAVAESVGIRLRVTNRSEQCVAVVARRGGQYAREVEGHPVYWLRIQVRSRDDPRWQRLQRPAWSSPWPKLDFRSSRLLPPGEAWRLETAVYRPDIPLIRGGRPDEIMIELVDARRRQIACRILPAE